jgi:hypothetical protein
MNELKKVLKLLFNSGQALLLVLLDVITTLPASSLYE